MLDVGIHFVIPLDQIVLEILLKYLNPAVLFADTNYLTYTIFTFLIFSFLLIVLFIVLFFSQWNYTRNSRHSLAFYYLHKIIGVILIILKHVLCLPILFLLTETINCEYHIGEGKIKSPDFECFGALHLILLAASALTLILLTVLILLSLILFSDEQLDSTLPWAYGSRHLEIYQYIRKIYLCFILCFCSSSKELFMISYLGMFLFSFGCLYELYHLIYMNFMSIYYALSTSECLILITSLLNFFDLINSKNMNNFFIFILIILILSLFVLFFSNYQKKKFMLNKNIEDLREVPDVETYIRILINLVNSCSSDRKVSINGIMAFHSSSCKRSFCYCSKILVYEEKEMDDENLCLNKGDFEKNEAASQMKQLEFWNSELEGNLGENFSKGREEQKILLYKFLIQLVNEWNESQDSNVRLQLLQAYLKLYCFENCLPALYQLMCARESSPTFLEEYLIFRCLRQIEEQIILKEGHQQSSNEIDNLIDFQQVLTEMQESMQETLKLFIGFWKELLDESPNFQYIGNMSHDISQLSASIRRDYSRLIEINPINLYCRMLYALFLKKVIQDEYEAYDVHEQINATNNNIRIQHSHADKDKFGVNSKTSLLIISGEKENLGEVLCVNNEVCEMLGYEKNNILEHNISYLMNPALASVHNQLILNFFDSGVVSKTSDRLIFPLHKLGYIIPCTVLHRASPDLSQGLKLISFMQKVQELSEYTTLVEKNVTTEEVAIFLTDEQFGLHAFNLKAANLMGVNPALSNIRKFLLDEEKISLKKLIPDLNYSAFLDDSRSPGIAQITLDVKKINRLIESEIECLKIEQEQSELIPSSEEETKEYISMWAEGKIKVPLSYLNLQYGKYTKYQTPVINFKLVMIYLEIVEEKNFSKEIEADEEALNLNEGKNNKEVFFDDMVSQSQSSHSSTSASFSEKKNVRSFKERIKDQENPFFVRCFIKLGIITFLLILTSSIIDFILIRFHLRLLNTSYHNADLIYKRYNYLLAIPNSFRTLYQIYIGKEPNESDIYSDRATVYLNYIETSLEKLREASNQIDSMDHSFSDSHRAILDNPIIRFAQKPDTQSVSSELSYTYQTLLLAITKYVAMGTEIKLYNSSWLCSGAVSASAYTNYTIDRLMSYMITNGKHSLRYYISKSQDFFYEEMESSIHSSELVILVSLIITPLIISLFMMLFIPFIFKVQSNLLRIYLHLCQFPPEDLNKWLEGCNNSASLFYSSISQIRKTYASELFEAKKIEYTNVNSSSHNEEVKETTMQSLAHNTTTKGEHQEEDQDKESPDEGFEQSIESISERKQKMFSSMTQEKTRVYLFLLLCFILYIGFFRTLDGIAFYYTTHETELRQYIYRLMSDRSISGISTQLFVREQYCEKTLQSDPDHAHLTEYFVDMAFEAEMNTSRARAKLTGHLIILKDYLNHVDTSENCNYLFQTASEVSQCKSVYEGLIPIGYNSVILHAIIFAQKLDGLFRQNSYVDPEFASSFQFVKMNDVRTKYGEKIFDSSFSLYQKALNDWGDEKVLIQNLKFSFFLILLFCIFIFLWREMVSNMQMDIIKALGILNILPTSHLSTHPEFIQDMIKSSLIT